MDVDLYREGPTRNPIRKSIVLARRAIRRVLRPYLIRIQAAIGGLAGRVSVIEEWHAARSGTLPPVADAIGQLRDGLLRRIETLERLHGEVSGAVTEVRTGLLERIETLEHLHVEGLGRMREIEARIAALQARVEEAEEAGRSTKGFEIDYRSLSRRFARIEDILDRQPVPPIRLSADAA